MESVLFVKISQQTQSGSSGRNNHAGDLVSSNQLNVTVKKRCPVPILATIWELVFVACSSTICSAYAINHENTTVRTTYADLQIPVEGTGYFEWILDPPPTVMLAACIILGCAISSFAYRRQEQDRYQTSLFLLAIGLACTFGGALSINANLIMLALIPWAMFIAMTFSITLHWTLRRLSHQSSPRLYFTYGPGDKKQQVPEC